uniref:Proteasome subunit beta n=1 Tax=Paramoeba aestuarina TaxID=180227 RepID=A0A7S4PGD9_9EUKA|mmetsp:Transcript_5938/g.8994  ORF Transcript_5938/g.8994 Transcript_5938/m.8994 type:complete len:209 (+) Transcript_5938:119-745(+)
MSILEYNGGSVVAMKGKDCVVIASDHRYGIRFQTISMNYPKIHRLNNKCFVGLTGLATDTQTIHERLKFRLQMYKLKEGREMGPKVLSNVINSILYERRFGPYFVEPVVCGLEETDDGGIEPYIYAADLIGAGLYADDFVVAGTASEALYGLCESLYKPDMGPEETFEVVSQSLLAAVNRDAYSGWGASVYIIEKGKTTVRQIKGRVD